MRAKLMLITIFCLFAVSAFSQQSYLDVLINYTPTNFHYGELNSELKDFKKNVGSLQLGVSYQGGITSHFSVVSELFLMMKGGRLKANNPLTNVETTTRLFTLEMPLLARVHLGGVYLNAGGSVGYNLFGKIKTKGTESIPEMSNNISFDGSEGSYKRWDAGLQFGLGYEVQLKKARVAFDARYHYGLVDVFNGVEKYNRYFILNILVSKPLKKNPLASAKK